MWYCNCCGDLTSVTLKSNYGPQEVVTVPNFREKLPFAPIGTDWLMQFPLYMDLSMCYDRDSLERKLGTQRNELKFNEPTRSTMGINVFKSSIL